MAKITTGMFVFDATNKFTGEFKKIEYFGNSRFSAYNALMRDEGVIWDIKWA